MRLTKALQKEILNLVLQQRFEKDISADREENRQLALEVYHHRFDEKERKLMASLPKGWLPETDTILARFGQNEFFGKLPSPVRITAEYLNRYGGTGFLLSLNDDHKLSKRYAKYIARHRELAALQRKAQVETATAIRQFSTTQKLVKAWPEIKTIVDKLVEGSEKSQPTTALAVRFDKLNELLKLK